MAKLINIGFGNVVNSPENRSCGKPGCTPVKTNGSECEGFQFPCGCHSGRKTKSVIVTSDHILILSAIQPDTIACRFAEL